MHTHTRSVAHKIFDAWRSPGRFTKNPEIVVLPNDRMLLVYADTDAHWSMKNQILTLLASDDGGQTWHKHMELDRAELAKGEERLVTPRLSLLKDGRLCVIIDHNDDTHFHEDQPPGNWLYWSSDNGETWEKQTENGILGFEPDRVIDLPDGTLGCATHLEMGDSQEYAQAFYVSEDGGKTWHQRSIQSHDGYYRYCEGMVMLMHGGKRLACVIRENHSGGVPSFVVFSDDNGHTWSKPQFVPFAFHRPYAQQLKDGRTFVTGRHVNGGLGCYGWVGDLEAEAGTHVIGGPRRKFKAELTSEALVIQNALEHECRYTMLPAENPFSEMLFEAEVRVEASRPEASVAFLSLSTIGEVLEIAPNGVYLWRGRNKTHHAVDMTQYHTITLHHKRGWLQVKVDGETKLHKRIFRDVVGGVQDFHGGNVQKRTQFGQFGDSGRSYWRSVTYDIKNRTLDDYAWSWSAAGGEWPDQYQRDRLIQIHPNHPAQQPNPDHGYSSWIEREDGSIFFVDYTNCGDVPDSSHLVGVYIDPEDLA